MADDEDTDQGPALRQARDRAVQDAVAARQRLDAYTPPSVAGMQRGGTDAVMRRLQAEVATAERRRDDAQTALDRYEGRAGTR